MSRFSALPTPQELGTMKEDLEFKTGEMKKSEHTTVGLAAGGIHFYSQHMFLSMIMLFHHFCTPSYLLCTLT